MFIRACAVLCFAAGASQAANTCEMPIEPGPCDGVFPRFAFNPCTGGCESFIYGGCSGNANNFETLEECADACRTLTPCVLPIDPGPCGAAIQRYAYDTSLGQCVQFIYGGCGGNDNNYETLAECEVACEPDACTQPVDQGPCGAVIDRWSFSPCTGLCEPFVYGGCGGNDNNFSSYEECEQACPPASPCLLSVDPGPCGAVIPRYAHNAATGLCELFNYGGCGGNDNNYATVQECEQACPPPDICHLSRDEGPCAAVITRFGYDPCLGQCDVFNYGGCEGNANNFTTLAACMTACPSAPAPCTLAIDPGPCGAAIPRFAHNPCTGMCEEFVWGGCGGNANNFLTLGDCESACPPPDPCHLSADQGPCAAVIPRYAHNPATGLCEEFVWGGCGGNVNNHLTLQECEQACPPPSPCQFSLDPGDCQAAIPRFGFNSCTRQCEEFNWGGCGGNANNYLTLGECEASCPVINACDMVIDPGPCAAVIVRYGLDPNTGFCEPFNWGGCGGNANNFLTLAECEAACPPPETCLLPADPGPCQAAIPRFHYNACTSQCESFNWGGCGGNANNFVTLNECEQSCSRSSVCAETADCADTNGDNIRDDNCIWWECSAPACNGVAIPFADMGGPFGTCPPDGFANIHDRNHALSCFAGTNVCDPMNIDAGGAFGACPPDGFCNIHDANHALSAFAGTNVCTCGPAPEMPPIVVGQARLRVEASQREAGPGTVVPFRIYSDDAIDDLRGYQLDVIVTGGASGSLQLVAIEIESRKDFVFANRPDGFSAVNETTGQMLAGLEGAGHPARRRGYMATYFYRVSRDAAGSFVVDVRSDDDSQTYLIASENGKIDVDAVTPGLLHIGPAVRRPTRR